MMLLETNTAGRQQKLAETLVEKQPLFFIEYDKRYN